MPRILSFPLSRVSSDIQRPKQRTCFRTRPLYKFTRQKGYYSTNMIRRTSSRGELAGTTMQAWISQHHKIMSSAWQKLKTSLRSFNPRFTSCPRSSVSPFQAEASSRLSPIRNYTLVSLHTSERLFAVWLYLRPKKNHDGGTRKTERWQFTLCFDT